MAYMTKATAQLMRDLGSIQSPQNAFLLNIGLETLHLRMPQHCGNAQKVAEYLQANDQVAWVEYCGLPGNKYYDLAQKYMTPFTIIPPMSLQWMALPVLPITFRLCRKKEWCNPD